MISKLEFCGIYGPTQDWIRAFLTSRTQIVMIDGCHSSEDTVDSGVPQGTILGPLLFLIHISDMPIDTGTAVRLFADDCFIYRSINSEVDQLQLQKDPDAAGDFRCHGESDGARGWRDSCGLDKIIQFVELSPSQHSRLSASATSGPALKLLGALGDLNRYACGLSQSVGCEISKPSRESGGSNG